MSQEGLETQVQDQYFEQLKTVIEGFSEDTGRAPSVEDLEDCLQHSLPHANPNASLEDWWYVSELLHSVELFRSVRGTEIVEFEPVLADVFENLSSISLNLLTNSTKETQDSRFFSVGL